MGYRLGVSSRLHLLVFPGFGEVGKYPAIALLFLKKKKKKVTAHISLPSMKLTETRFLHCIASNVKYLVY